MLMDVFEGIVVALQWQSVMMMLIGTALGLIIGALPGLSSTMAIALTIPFTFAMSPFVALGLLAGLHNGASQGGAIPAVLLRIPSNAGSVCTVWDGYPMAKQGLAAQAIQLAAVSSAVGGMFSAASLILLAPPLAVVALAFGPPELVWVTFLGLATVATMLGDNAFKGIVATCIGLLVSMVGLDAVSGRVRFTFGISELVDGLPSIAVMVGMLSLLPIWELARRSGASGGMDMVKLVRNSRPWRYMALWGVWVRSSLIGILMGILPGSQVSSFIAYAAAKRTSKTPEQFGKGSPEGLAAAESVNNADNAAAMIPTLTLGVPGSNIAALMLGALLIQGFQPGPQLFRDAPEIVFGYAWQMFFTSLLLIPFGGLLASRIFSQVLRVPPVMLIPLVICLVVVGSTAQSVDPANLMIIFAFGLIALGMKYFGFPIAPAIIAVVLGDQLEFNFRISLLMSGGDPMILVNRPITMVMLAILVLIVLFAVWRTLRPRKRTKPAPPPDAPRPES